MDGPKVLLVFYSRSGHTRAVAHALRDALSCDVDEILDETDRRGLLGYLRSAVDATFHRKASVLPLKVDPADYDLVEAAAQRSPDVRISVGEPAEAARH